MSSAFCFHAMADLYKDSLEAFPKFAIGCEGNIFAHPVQKIILGQTSLSNHLRRFKCKDQIRAGGQEWRKKRIVERYPGLTMKILERCTSVNDLNLLYYRL